MHFYLFFLQFLKTRKHLTSYVSSLHQSLLSLRDVLSFFFKRPSLIETPATSAHFFIKCSQIFISYHSDNLFGICVMQYSIFEIWFMNQCQLSIQIDLNLLWLEMLTSTYLDLRYRRVECQVLVGFYSCSHLLLRNRLFTIFKGQKLRLGKSQV